MSGWIETNQVSEWWADRGIVHGSAHAVSGHEPDDDPAERVHKVAEEVTRGKIPCRPPVRFGFIP